MVFHSKRNRHTTHCVCVRTFDSNRLQGQIICSMLVMKTNPKQVHLAVDVFVYIYCKISFLTDGFYSHLCN